MQRGEREYKGGVGMNPDERETTNRKVTRGEERLISSNHSCLVGERVMKEGMMQRPHSTGFLGLFFDFEEKLLELTC